MVTSVRLNAHKFTEPRPNPDENDSIGAEAMGEMLVRQQMRFVASSLTSATGHSVAYSYQCVQRSTGQVGRAGLPMNERFVQ